jgi:site-specific DNA-methyltransferase (adenine-specific)
MRDPDWISDDGAIRLYCADATTLEHHQPVDLIITDPPYGIAHKCDFANRGRDNLAACNDYADVHGDFKPFDPAWLVAFGVPTVLWGGNHFASRLPDSGGWLVWDKERPDTLDQATCELAWTNCVKGVRRLRHLWHGMMRDSEHGENYHPTQKPVVLFDWIFTLPWIVPGTVFDPYMGSGPCGVSAVRAGRSYVGCELHRPYFDIAVRRIKNELAQPKLPFAEPVKHEQADMFTEESNA